MERYTDSVHREFVNLGRLLPRFAAHFVSAGALNALERLASTCHAHLSSMKLPMPGLLGTYVLVLCETPSIEASLTDASLTAAGKQLEDCLGPAGRAAGAHARDNIAQLQRIRQLFYDAFRESVPRVRCPCSRRRKCLPWLQLGAEAAVSGCLATA